MNTYADLEAFLILKTLFLIFMIEVCMRLRSYEVFDILHFHMLAYVYVMFYCFICEETLVVDLFSSFFLCVRVLVQVFFHFVHVCLLATLFLYL
uniref:DEAD-box ATP-dependent RNA helicase 56 isoform X2 n=1 Tax=Rhizophora mucronata TaxID=61149 RepID=A0A2P2MKY4_RHIMU